MLLSTLTICYQGLVCIFVDKNIASDRPLSAARVPKGLVSKYKIRSVTRPMVIHTAWLVRFMCSFFRTFNLYVPSFAIFYPQ
jgi:hypothetical protein